MASGLYAKTYVNLAAGAIVWKATGGSNIDMALVLAAYTPDFDTHEFVSAIGTNRANSSAVDIADEDLTLADPTIVGGSDEVQFSASSFPHTYSSVDNGQSVKGVLIFKRVTNDADSLIIAWCEFAAPVSANGSDITVTQNAAGLWKLTY